MVAKKKGDRKMTDNWQNDMTKIIKRADVSALTIYDCAEIIDEIELAAQQSEGELTEDQWQKLVEAQTQSIVKLQKLCGAIIHYEQGIELCKQQENRIAEARRRAEKRIESIKKYLMPYVRSQGKPIQAGTFTLSTRKSTSTFVSLPNALDPEYLRTIPARFEPDKDKIKKALQEGKQIRGAELQVNYHLTIK